MKKAECYRDSLKIKQVCINVVDNAVKFKEAGGIVAVDILITDYNEQQLNIHFIVTDTGVGISLDRIETIFHSFVELRIL